MKDGIKLSILSTLVECGCNSTDSNLEVPFSLNIGIWCMYCGRGHGKGGIHATFTLDIMRNMVQQVLGEQEIFLFLYGLTVPVNSISNSFYWHWPLEPKLLER